jgi:DNA-binding response OmpR family regulator
MATSGFSQHSPRAGERRLRVLVVDDYPGAAETLAWLLRREGHVADAADTADAALAAAQAAPPDAILMDLILPGTDGYALTKQLRGLCPVKPLLVALTGHGEDEDRKRSLAEGFDFHLVKPVDLEELMALLRVHARTLAPT